MSVLGVSGALLLYTVFMKIAYCGNGRYYWCTEVEIATDLRSLGHEVDFIQEPDTMSAAAAIIPEVEERAKAADLFLYTRTWGFPQQATDLWRRIEAAGTPTASLHLDLYFGLPRASTLEGDPFWTTQHVFTPDGDPGSERKFAAMGINHHYLSPGVFSEACYTGDFDPRFDYDVVFTGTPYANYHPQWTWRRDLLDWLSSEYGDRFQIFSGFDKGGPTRGKDLNNLCATAKVVVGDSLCPPGHINYWSDRAPATLGRSGFLIHPRVPGIENSFTEGEHLLFYDYGNFDEIREKVQWALDNPEASRKIATQGQEHVRNNHTYKHRLAAAFEVMGLQ